MRSASYLSILLLIFLSFTVSATSIDCQQHHCMAVIDSGSTGSRLHIYAYDLDQTNTATNITELWSKKVKPGLATLEASQGTMDAYLRTLFSEAPVDNMPVYFYATAGMRLQSQSKQKQIYGLVNKWFDSQTQWNLKSARTISGTEEGLFGWLAVNYQLGTLNSLDKPTVGVMDMGGASVQISFPVDNTEGLNEADLLQVNLYGRRTKLFVHSFLGLGQTEVTHQYLNAPSCFAKDYKLPSGQAADGDSSICEKEITLLINSVHRVSSTVQPAMSINRVNDWYVLGGMAELVRSKPFVFASKQFSNEALINQANSEVCQQSWSTLSSLYPNDEFFYGYCLFPAYYYALMVDGYGIEPTLAIRYLTGNQGGDWTTGVVLNQRFLL